MKYYKLKDLAQVSGLPFGFIYRLVREEQLKHFRSGNAFYSSEEWLSKALEKLAK